MSAELQNATEPVESTSTSPGSTIEVLRAFLQLGVSAFGGPIAHVGYFRQAFVMSRGWLDEQQFSQLLAVCQLLPGPTSSQLGFAIGGLRAGLPGALAAFVAFTLPSALLLFALAALASRMQAGWAVALLHGLQLVAVSVVAHALLGMTRSLAFNLRRIVIAVAAAALVLLAADAWMQWLVIVLGALAGWLLCRDAVMPVPNALPLRWGIRMAALALLAFLVLLVAAAVLSSATPSISALASAFYRAGALVFGGGHVVLPMLKASVVDSGWISSDGFVAGYGAAQAVPGPLFSLSAFVGAQVPTGHPALLGAVTALLAVFLPGFLLLIAVLPGWQRLLALRGVAPALAGVNAAVVGLLAGAFYDPVCSDSLQSSVDFAIAGAAFVLLQWLGWSSLRVVVFCAAASVFHWWLVS